MAVNERDELGSDLVPDYLTSVRDGAFCGWPLGLSVIDIAWGTAISAASAIAGKLVADRFAS